MFIVTPPPYCNPPLHKEYGDTLAGMCHGLYYCAPHFLHATHSLIESLIDGLSDVEALVHHHEQCPGKCENLIV